MFYAGCKLEYHDMKDGKQTRHGEVMHQPHLALYLVEIASAILYSELVSHFKKMIIILKNLSSWQLGRIFK
jgi:hypothetical protein